jgi:hypothetical protein
MPGSFWRYSSARSGSIALSVAGSRAPSSAARATACSHSTRCGATLRSDSAFSSRWGSGNACSCPPVIVNVRPNSADSRSLIAAAWPRYRRALMMDQAAASYGEWKSTGRKPPCSR